MRNQVRVLVSFAEKHEKRYKKKMQLDKKEHKKVAEEKKPEPRNVPSLTENSKILEEKQKGISH